MKGSLYFSRARLKKDAPLKELAPLLLGETGRNGPARHTGHHLIWSLFADTSDRQRDFLWREMATGVFFILSARPPADPRGLFEIAEPKPFSPVLASGDNLSFSLRANPVVRRRNSSRSHSSKHDVVMDALRNHPDGDRASRRFDTIREAGLAWLHRQGERSGFSILNDQVRVDGYEQHRVTRKRSARPMSFSTLDFEGMLTVGDPDVFLPAIASGFGSAKGYGCGLMLIRRALTGATQQTRANAPTETSGP